ncbi:MAG TPA: hypothetical protein VMU56_01270, partial [Beijerinckiaceae bacterium]|nr:hypothetical protein [Beijerinckiaceae bacterium]
MTRGALLLCICALTSGPAGASPVIGPDVPMPPERPAILSHRAGGTVREIPLPPVRPADLGAVAWAPTQPSVVSSDAGGECAALEASGVVVGSLETPITGPGACGIASPIRLSDIVLPNGERVAILPPALMRCALASTLAAWVR